MNTKHGIMAGEGKSVSIEAVIKNSGSVNSVTPCMARHKLEMAEYLAGRIEPYNLSLFGPMVAKRWDANQIYSNDYMNMHIIRRYIGAPIREHEYKPEIGSGKTVSRVYIKDISVLTSHSELKIKLDINGLALKEIHKERLYNTLRECA